MMHFWPYIGKIKMCLRRCKIFKFWNICVEFSAVCLPFFKISTTSQTHVGFTNLGSEMHCFSFAAIYFGWFSIRTPCTGFILRTVYILSIRKHFYTLATSPDFTGWRTQTSFPVNRNRPKILLECHYTTMHSGPCSIGSFYTCTVGCSSITVVVKPLLVKDPPYCKQQGI